MQEIIHSFGVDWKILLAQVVNFFILLVILTKFVYKPLIQMLHKRRDDIEKGIEFTKKAEENLRDANLTKENIAKGAKEEALKIISSAEDAANIKSKEIIAEGGRKRDGMVAEAKGIIEEHKNKSLDTLHSNAESLVRAGMEKVLGKMSPADRDKELIKETMKEIRLHATEQKS